MSNWHNPLAGPVKHIKLPFAGMDLHGGAMIGDYAGWQPNKLRLPTSAWAGHEVLEVDFNGAWLFPYQYGPEYGGKRGGIALMISGWVGVVRLMNLRVAPGDQIGIAFSHDYEVGKAMPRLLEMESVNVVEPDGGETGQWACKWGKHGFATAFRYVHCVDHVPSSGEHANYPHGTGRYQYQGQPELVAKDHEYLWHEVRGCGAEGCKRVGRPETDAYPPELQGTHKHEPEGTGFVSDSTTRIYDSIITGYGQKAYLNAKGEVVGMGAGVVAQGTGANLHVLRSRIQPGPASIHARLALGMDDGGQGEFHSPLTGVGGEQPPNGHVLIEKSLLEGRVLSQAELQSAGHAGALKGQAATFPVLRVDGAVSASVIDSLVLGEPGQYAVLKAGVTTAAGNNEPAIVAKARALGWIADQAVPIGLP